MLNKEDFCKIGQDLKKLYDIREKMMDAGFENYDMDYVMDSIADDLAEGIQPASYESNCVIDYIYGCYYDKTVTSFEQLYDQMLARKEEEDK